MSNQTLRDRTLKAGAWVLSGHFGSQLLRLISNLIMTRLLAPEMFGIMAIVNTLVLGIALFSDVGIQQSLIQSKRDDKVYINTAWTLQIVRGVAIFLFSLGIAVSIYVLSVLQVIPAVSTYANPVLPYVLAVLSISAIITGFESTSLTTLNRQLNLRRVVAVELLSQIVGIIMMITWAASSPTIWAMVAGALITAVIKTYLSHHIHDGGRHQVMLDRTAVNEIVGYGKWVFIGSILGFLAANGDRLLLGVFVDAEAMGYFAIAVLLATTAQQVLQGLIAKVAFPVLSEVVRTRKDDLKSVYYKLRLPVDGITLASSGFLFSAGALLVSILYDQRYAYSGYMLEVLSIGLMQVRFTLAGQCYMALGKPKLVALILFLRVIGLFALLPSGFFLYGMDGAVWAITLAIFLPLPLSIYLKYRYGILNIAREMLVLPIFPLGFLLGELFKKLLG
jgi:O-antigen/teichoic acid export membrane protein